MTTITNDKKNPRPQKAGLDFTVQNECELLTFLIAALPRLSRNSVKTLLQSKAVFVDNTPVTQYNHRLYAGQQIRVNPRNHTPEPSNILYEDDELIAINKPSGLLSIGSDSEKERTAYHMMTEYVRRSGVRNQIFVVHRLDRDTSGVLVFAKNEKIKLALQNHWSNIVTTRGYTAIVEGTPTEPSSTIRSFLLETKTHLMYSSKSAGDGLEAITKYQVSKQSAEYSLLDVRLLTGRKNQIRVHMKELGHPVVGDKKYGSVQNPLGRMGLHANLLEFTHPVTNQNMRFEAPVPPEFTRLFR